MRPAPESRLKPGLYIVATPIGNLGDMTARAERTLRAVQAVACEDTRVTGRLLKHLGITARLIRYDDHADERARDKVLNLAECEPTPGHRSYPTPAIAWSARRVRAAWR